MNISQGFSVARQAYRDELRREEERKNRELEREAREDQIATDKVVNSQTRRTAPGRGDADIAVNRSRLATANETERSAGIVGRRNRSDAGLAISQNASDGRRIASDEDADISGNVATTAENQQRLLNAPVEGEADRAVAVNRGNEARGKDRTLNGRVRATNAESTNRAAEANRKTNTVNIREEADAWEAQARQRRKELEALKDSLSRDSGALEIGEEEKFAESMTDFLQSMYETAKYSGERAADLLNDFDLNNDGDPDIVGAANVVIENGEIRVLNKDGQPVIDGSTGAPAIYDEEEFKAVLDSNKKQTTTGRSSSSSTKKPDINKYSTKVRDAVQDSVYGRLNINPEFDEIGVDVQEEIDLVSGVVDGAMNYSGLSLNNAVSKYGSPAKILKETGHSQADLTDAANQMGVSESEVLRQIMVKKFSQ